MTRTATIAMALLLATACSGDGDTAKSDSESSTLDTDQPVDNDGDNWTEADGDCDDSNADVYPGQTETCNGVDDNCNGVTDEGLDDADGDGVCDDLDEESCDGDDNDGDGAVDEDFGDADGDGVADCEDSETCDGTDEDGDGDVDEGYDADGDGYTSCGDATTAPDCDDSVASVNPGETEDDDDLVDNDCDVLVDEGNFASGDLFITEIMNNPSKVADPYGEWFELYNASDREIAINGLTITGTDGDSHQVESDDVITVEAGAYIVLGSNSDSTTNGGVSAVEYAYSGITLSNDSDDLWVMAGEVALDSVEWDDGASFPDPSGASMTLDPAYNEADYNDSAEYWCAAPSAWSALTDNGSPGEVNDSCESIDHDGDGYTVEDGDCDDDNADYYPGAPETDASVDQDCDGDAEQGPSANASIDSGASDLEECGVIYVTAQGSSDPQGDTPLTYEWELTSAPSASALTTDDIEDADQSRAWLVPDASGTYTFSLTVYDSGDAASEPDTVSTTISARGTNNTPSANAGSNQSSSDSVTCTSLSYGASYDCDPCDDWEVSLDGSGSTDADGDDLSYQWTVTSGSASIDDDESETPNVTVAGPTPSYGGTSTETVYITLKATDCMGATSSSDTVVLTYSCTGN